MIGMLDLQLLGSSPKMEQYETDLCSWSILLASVFHRTSHLHSLFGYRNGLDRLLVSHCISSIKVNMFLVKNIEHEQKNLFITGYLFS